MTRKPKEIPDIYVDIFEAQSGLAEAIRRRNLGNVIEQQMETGDIVIRYKGIDIGWEIKRGNDLDNSIKDGRLHDQLYRCINTFSFPGLIVEGWHPYVGDDTTEDDIAKTVTKFKKTMWRFNDFVTTYETKDQEETIDLIESKITNIRLGKFKYLRRKILLEDSTDGQINFIAGLPFVGINKAQELLDIFGSPENALNHIAEWIEISGITESRLQKIKDVYSKEVQR
jgi:ERCC4-type nuclease